MLVAVPWVGKSVTANGNGKGGFWKKKAGQRPKESVGA
jgi:hypothetical protein